MTAYERMVELKKEMKNCEASMRRMKNEFNRLGNTIFGNEGWCYSCKSWICDENCMYSYMQERCERESQPGYWEV